jgi:hypothetical protein
MRKDIIMKEVTMRRMKGSEVLRQAARVVALAMLALGVIALY